MDSDREDIMPMTTRLSNGFPPCLFSSSARMLSCCLLFPAGRDGVGAFESSLTAPSLDGVSAAVTSGLGPLRTEEATTPFSSALQMDTKANITSEFLGWFIDHYSWSSSQLHSVHLTQAKTRLRQTYNLFSIFHCVQFSQLMFLYFVYGKFAVKYNAVEKSGGVVFFFTF